MFLWLKKYQININLYLILSNLISILRYFWDKVLSNIKFLPTYYSRNENLWVDGFLFDFLQKKTADLWIRQFVIYTGFLFSERLVFDALIKLYLDNMIWPFHKNSIFETSNVSEMLVSVLFLYITLFFMLLSSYIFFIL